MANFDEMKFAVESLTGGKNTVLLDDVGMPSIMVVIPKMYDDSLFTGGTAVTHPAFIVNSVEKDKAYIGKYINSVYNNRGYSLPFKAPQASVAFDTANTYCRNKGAGWGLTPNALWAAIALYCKKSGFMPNGNNGSNKGGDCVNTWERGVKAAAITETIYTTLTGSGPQDWNHNNAADGIADMNGNVWEWQGGLRLNEGEIQVIPNADSILATSDMSATSAAWKAISSTGAYVAAGTSGSLKYDYVNAAATSGALRMNTAVTNKQSTDSPYAANTFESLTAISGLTPPELAKALCLYPADANSHGGDYIFMRNIGERLPFRGGSAGNGGGAGVFALGLSYPRSDSGWGIGFRAAFYE